MMTHSSLKQCDDQNPACSHCQRVGVSCLVNDPQTKAPVPRNYLEVLKDRVASLENQNPGTSSPSTSSPVPVVGQAETEVTEHTPLDHNTLDRRDDDSNFSSRVGLLDVRATLSEPHFLGPSSAFAFSRIVNLSLTKDLPTDTTFSSITDKYGTVPSPCQLPEYHIAVKLSDAYFRYIHPQYPFLHEPTFRSQEVALYNELRNLTEPNAFSASLFFLNMVYSVAALLLPNAHNMAEQLYMSAQIHTDAVLSKNNIESIQALLCYAMYSLRSSTGPSLWKLSGMALRQCIELGYHRSIRRNTPWTNPVQREMRKRVFWVSHGIDTMVALRLGRPLGIPLQEIDVELPADIDDTSVTEAGISQPPQGNTGQNMTTMSTALHVFRLRYIWARIQITLYSGTVNHSVQVDTYHTLTAGLRAELDSWLATAPISRPSTTGDLSIFTTNDWYHMNYNYTILLLYQRALAQYKESSDYIFASCIEASKNICQGCRRLYIGTAVRYTWGTLYTLFLAGLVYLHCLWMSPTALSSVHLEDISKTCTDCTMVLVAIAEGWKSAAPYRDTFGALASRTLTMFIEKSRALSSGPTPLNPVSFEDQDSWTHWIDEVAGAGVLDGVETFLTGLVGDFHGER